jgi:hypothetical protein
MPSISEFRAMQRDLISRHKTKSPEQYFSENVWRIMLPNTQDGILQNTLAMALVEDVNKRSLWSLLNIIEKSCSDPGFIVVNAVFIAKECHAKPKNARVLKEAIKEMSEDFQNKVNIVRKELLFSDTTPLTSPSNPSSNPPSNQMTI